MIKIAKNKHKPLKTIHLTKYFDVGMGLAR
jgi:hypothetical protein